MFYKGRSHLSLFVILFTGLLQPHIAFAARNSTDNNWLNNTNWHQTTSPCLLDEIRCDYDFVPDFSSKELSSPISLVTFNCNNASGIPFTECKALVALYNNTNGNNWHNNTGWLQNTTPCSWYGVTCNAGFVSHLALNDNQLSGNIPPELGQLSKLIRIYLNSNQLSGSIPSELRQLSSLTHLNLYDNDLSGNIPPELGQLSSLTNLYLRENKLSGSIPPELGQLSNLELFSLYDNDLSGSIPSELGQLSNLTNLSFDGNRLSGSIPSELGQLSSLIVLTLNNNELSGDIPSELGQLSNLETLSLDGNQLSGNIPSELEQLSNLATLFLGNNELSGSILPGLGQLSNLTRLSFYNNQLSGSIPPELGQLSNLTLLNLSNNQLEGCLPIELSSLSLGTFRFDATQVQEPSDAAFQNWLSAITDLHRTNVPCGTQDKMLWIYLYAGDNPITNTASLAPFYRPAVQGLIDATAIDSSKTAIVLGDLNGKDNTAILLIQNGVVTVVDGLPDANGILSNAITEYDMTDGDQLGGFLKWTLDNYTDAVTKTSLSYIGHGTFIAPETDLDVLFFPNNFRNNMGLLPLPIRGSFMDDFTDVTPKKTIITPYALRQMLKIGTNKGKKTLDVLDLTHCFAATVEELYEVVESDTEKSYATMLVGSPAIAYFAPEMLGATLRAMDVNDDASTLASTLITTYDNIFSYYDTLDGDPDVDHPRALMVYESNQIPAIKDAVDILADQVMNQLERQPIIAQNKLAAAHANAGQYYDTTFCQADWTMDSSDALVDISALMKSMQAQFGTFSGVGLQALAVDGAVQNALVDSITHNGSPWYGNPLAQAWSYDNATLAVYADFEGYTTVDDHMRTLSWQATFYTDTVSTINPHPPLFIQDGTTGSDHTWADVFHRFWEIKAPNGGLTTLVTKACLPEFPPLPDVGELAAIDMTLPLTGTLRVEAPTVLQGTIQTTLVINAEVQFDVYEVATGLLVYSDTVNTGYLFTGTHNIVASQPFTPTKKGDYRFKMTVDANNRFIETDENDNSISRIERAYKLPSVTIDAKMANDQQQVTSRTIDLDLTSSQDSLNWLIVHVYGHTDDPNNPNFQLPKFVGEVIVNNPTLPNHSLALPAALQAGRVTLHIWGIAGAGISNPHAVVTFNYAPQTTLAAIGDSDYYVFNAEAGDDMAINCSLVNGGAQMLIWQPGNYWSAEEVSCDGTISYNPARAGEYLVKVIATAANTKYSVSTNRNGIAGGRSLNQSVSTVIVDRPDLVAPVPNLNQQLCDSDLASSDVVLRTIGSSCEPNQDHHVFLPLVIIPRND